MKYSIVSDTVNPDIFVATNFRIFNELITFLSGC